MTTTTRYRNALPDGTNLLEYRVQSVLGAGGFGITYLCHDTHLDKRVAIKEYFPSDLAVRALDGGVISTNTEGEASYQWGLERFIQEARTLAKFSHPHIVRVNRYFEANDTGYMVIDYEDGHSLYQLFKSGPALNEASILQVLTPLLDGLRAVHDIGFLHRDIKPSNIFIRSNGSPVLLDFGSARQAMTGATKTLTSLITPGFAPLEQYTGDGNQGPWTDIYALGGVMFRALAGENPPDAVSRLKNDAVPVKLAPLKGRISAASLNAVEWALTIDEKSRPQSIEDWRKVLDGRAQAVVPVRAVVTEAATHVVTEPLGPATQRAKPTVRIVRAVPPETGSSVWRWIGTGALALFALAVGQNWYKRGQAKEQAAAEAAAHAASGRDAQTKLQAPQVDIAPPPAAQRAPEQIALEQREAALKQLEDSRAKEPVAAQKPAVVSVPPPPAPTQPPPPPDSPALEAARRNDPMAARKEMDFRRADVNGDGYLTPDEVRGMPMLSDSFRNVDGNVDGRISLEEFFNFRPLKPPPRH